MNRSHPQNAVCVSLRYLQEVGYTDTILDVKSQRVKALLGLAGDSGERPGEKRPEPMVNGTEPSSMKDSTSTMIGSVGSAGSQRPSEVFRSDHTTPARISLIYSLIYVCNTEDITVCISLIHLFKSLTINQPMYLFIYLFISLYIFI